MNIASSELFASGRAQRMLFSLVNFDRIPLAQANARLVEWGHKMGPLERPKNYSRSWSYGLFHSGDLVGVAIASNLIRPTLAGGLLTRDDTIELSRLCACRPHLCRVVLRLWREFAFPALPYRWAVSYQDAVLHSGNLYRFDGWKKLAFSHSGRDLRSGKNGRDKWLWVWPPPGPASPAPAADPATGASVPQEASP